MSLHINLCMPWGQTLSFPSPMGSKEEEYGRFPFEVGKKKHHFIQNCHINASREIDSLLFVHLISV